MAPWHGHHAVVEFTGHAVILTDRDPAEVLARAGDGFGGAAHPDVVRWLAGPGGLIGSHDAVLVARASGAGASGSRLVETSVHDGHPRVVRSRSHRLDVRVFADDDGLVTIGTGVAGRLEVSVELLDGRVHGGGAGRRLVTEALALIPAGRLLWAQVAPGNAASLRTFLSCGFRPIAAEILLHPAPTSDSATAAS
jgi:hypothetical protein